MMSHAPTQVLTDGFLFQRIRAFQRGLEMPLYEFWRAHTPDDASLRLTNATSQDLVELLRSHGNPALFAMAERARYSVTARILGTRISLRTLPLRHVACEPPAENRAEIVEWALVSKIYSVYYVEEVWRIAMRMACEDGDTCVLEVLKEHAPLREQEKMNRILSKRLRGIKHVSVLRWLVNEIPGLRLQPEMVNRASDRCDLSMLQFLHSRRLMPCDPLQVTPALFASRFDVLEYLFEHFVESIDPRSAQAIASHPDPEVLRIAVRFAEKLHAGCVAYINQNDYSVLQSQRLERIQQWINSGILSPQRSISIDTILARGYFDIVRLLHDNGMSITCDRLQMTPALYTRRFDVLECLLEHFGENINANDAWAIAANDDTEVQRIALRFAEQLQVGCVVYINQNILSVLLRVEQTKQWINRGILSPQWPILIDSAASNGHLDIVRLLHDTNIANATTEAMDNACANGHLRVVQYLQRHRSEGCTIAAVRGSLENGSLDIARFLFDNYRHLFECDAFDEALVTSAARSALKPNGNLALVQFLFDHFPHLFSPDLLHDVLLRGMFDIYSALRIKYPEQADAVLESVLYEAGKSLELGTIRFIIEELGRRDLAHRAMDGAASRDIHGWMHWLRAVYAIAGPTSCRLSAVRLAARRVRVSFCSSVPEVFESVAYLLRVCCEPNAQQVATTELDDDLTSWDTVAEQAKAIWDQPLHPFLVDPRIASWAISDLLPLLPCRNHPVSHSLRSQSWPVLAAYRHDISMLEVLRDMAPMLKCTHASHCKSVNADDAAKLLSFEGTRDAAIAVGNLTMLQWLMEHIDLPVEPMLLGEALFCDQREIAEWLVDHHPEACTQVCWRSRWSLSPRLSNFLTDDMLDWLDDHHAVRNAPAFDGIVDYLVRVDDTNALRRLHARHPEVLMGRTNLLELERVSKTSDVVEWSQEVGYRRR